MECLFDGCDNFVRYLNNKKWIEESDDLAEAIKKSFQWAIFIEAMHSRLEAEDKLEEFTVKYSVWRETMSLPKLRFAGFQSACDELLNNILINNISDRDVVQTALDVYLEHCGEERTSEFLNRFSSEYLLLKLFASFVNNERNYDDAETNGRLCKAIWYDVMVKLLPEEAMRNEEKWSEYITLLMGGQEGVETLIFITIMKENQVQKVGSLIINRFLQYLAYDNVPVGGAVATFWKNFVRSDLTLLLLMFENHSDFFEEFIEFFLKFANEFRFDESLNTWTADNWLEFGDVVRLLKALITYEENQNVKNYCVHVIDTTEDTPFWQAVKRQINYLPQS